MAGKRLLLQREDCRTFLAHTIDSATVAGRRGGPSESQLLSAATHPCGAPSRGANHKGKVRYVARDYRTRSDHGPAPYCDSGKKGGICTDGTALLQDGSEKRS